MNGIGQKHLRWALVVCACLAQALFCAPAQAVQHLITAGEDWQGLASRVRPGDEIILMPGRHRGASFDSLIGTTDHPITIRGADPKNPSTIDSQRDGIRIKRVANVVIRDLNINGGTISGITLASVAADRSMSNSDGSKPASGAVGSVLLRNVGISRVGPRGQRHALLVTAVTDLHVENCRFEGWGGSAIEMISCHDVIITGCTFKGRDDHSQLNGIRARAGSDQIQIERCRFENAGERVISAGAVSDLKDFQPPPPTDAAPGTLVEAARVHIEHCIIVGGKYALVFDNANDCLARSNTIIRPRGCVLALISEQKDPRFSPGQRAIFGENLIVWQPDDLQRMIEVADKIDVSKFVLEQNLWWSTESLDRRKRLGPFPGINPMPQTLDVDPKLDANFVPAEPGARAYGI